MCNASELEAKQGKEVGRPESGRPRDANYLSRLGPSARNTERERDHRGQHQGDAGDVGKPVTAPGYQAIARRWRSRDERCGRYLSADDTTRIRF